MGSLLDCIKAQKGSEQLLTDLTKEVALEADPEVQIKHISTLIAKHDSDYAAIKKTAERARIAPTAEAVTETELDFQGKPVNTQINHNKPIRFNVIKGFYKAQSKTKIAKNIIQHYTNFVKVLQIATKNSDVMNTLVQKTKQSPETAEAFIRNLAQFTKEFSKEFQGIFQPTSNADFLSENLLNYFKDEDTNQVKANVTAALAASAHKWLATRATGTLTLSNNDIAKLFGFSEGTYIPKDVQQLMHKIGVSEKVLTRQLGTVAFSLLNIKKDSSKITAGMHDKLINDLGLMTIGVLESQGLLKLNQMYTGRTKIKLRNTNIALPAKSDKLFGLDWVKARIAGEVSSTEVPAIFVDKLTSTDKQGNTTIFTPVNYYVVPHAFKDNATKDLILNKTIEDIVEAFNNSSQSWSFLFKGEQDNISYSFEPFEHSENEKRRLGDTEEFATDEQVKQQQEYENTSHTLIGSVFNLLHMFSPDQQNSIFGVKKPEDYHDSEAIGIKSKNEKIQRDMTALQSWVKDMPNHTLFENMGLLAPVFFRSEFSVQGREIMRGIINPQNSKIHRYLFSPTESKSINIPVTGNITNKAYTNFMRGIAESLDIEGSKTGSTVLVMKTVKAKLKNQDIKAAIEVLQKIITEQDIDTPNAEMFSSLIKEGKITKQELDIIVTGIAEAGTNVHGLFGLAEYAKFLNQKAAWKNNKTTENKMFSTRLFMETDGMSNGPMLFLTQFMQHTPDTVRALYQSLRNAGWLFGSQQASVEAILTDKRNHDIYQRVAYSTALELNSLEKELLKKNKLDQLRQIQAIKSLVGNLVDLDGAVNKAIRKFAKPPAMTTTFGAGIRNIINNLVHGTLIGDNINIRLVEISKLENEIQVQEAIDDLNNITVTLTGEKIVTEFDMQHLDKIRSAVLSQKALKRLHTVVEKGYGAALYAGVSKVYGEGMAVRGAMNASVKAATHLYNHVLKLALKQAYADNNNIELTEAQLQEVYKKVKAAMPKLNVPSGGQIDLTVADSNAILTASEQESSIKFNGIRNKKKVTRKKASSGISFQREDPGMRSPILGIHSIESFIANSSRKTGLPLLSVYDGFMGAVDKIGDISRNLNGALYNISKSYNLAQEMSASADRSITASLALLKELGLSQKEINKLTAESLEAVKNELKQLKNYFDIKNVSHVKQLLSIAKDIADTAAEQKAEFLNRVTGVNHYNDANGTFNTENTAETTLPDGTPVADMDNVTKEINAEKLTSKQLIDAAVQDAIAANKIGSTNNTEDLSENIEDYERMERVNESSVVDIYTGLRNTDQDNVSDSPEHDTHLKHILNNIIQGVVEPIKVYVTTSAHKITQGMLKIESDGERNIFMNIQSGLAKSNTSQLTNRSRMNAGTVYVHELVHHILEAGLETNSYLQEKLQKLFEVVKEELGEDGYKAFLADPENATNDEIETAKEQYEHIFNNKGINRKVIYNSVTKQYDIYSYSNHLTEFAAFGLTHEHFNKALVDIVISNNHSRLLSKQMFKELKGKNLQDTLLNIFNKIIEIFHQKFREEPSPSTAYDTLESLVQQLSATEAREKSKLYQLFEKADAMYNPAMDKVNLYIKKAFKTWPVIKAGHNMRVLGAAIYNNDSRVGDHIRKHINRWYNLEYGIAHGIIAEVLHNRELFKPVYQLLNMRDHILDSAKQKIIKADLDAYAADWDRPLESTEKVAILKVLLKANMQALLPHHKIEDIMAMISDPQKLNKAIADVQDKLKKLPLVSTNTFYYYNKTTEATGYYLITGKGTRGVDPVTNTSIISRLLATPADSLTEAEAQPATILLDQLISLYALSHADANHKSIVSGLAKESTRSLENIMIAHADAILTASMGEFKNAPMLQATGYMKSIINSDNKLELGTLADEAEMAKKGFTRELLPIPTDPADNTNNENPMYLYVGKGIGNGNDYVHGVMSSIRFKAKGTSIDSLYAGDTNKQNEILKAKAADVAALFSPVYNKREEHSTESYLIPQFNAEGELTTYKYVMSEKVKDNFLEQFNEYDTVLSAMRATSLEKAKTPVLNNQLIDALHDMYQKDYKHNTQAYVEISPYSENEEIRTYYHLMPREMQQHIKQVFGSHGLQIHQDILTSALGLHKYSILKATEKSKEEQHFLERSLIQFTKIFAKNSTARVLHRSMRHLMDITGLAKTNIVVRNTGVTADNYLSNIAYLKTKGVSLNNITKYTGIAWKEGIKYQIDSMDHDVLERKIKIIEKAGRLNEVDKLNKMKEKLHLLKNSLSRNPLKLFIDSGGMPTMVEGLDAPDNAKSIYPSTVHKTIDKGLDKLGDISPKAKKAANKLFLTQDSTEYKILNNAVKMTDFVSRYVLYMHYTELVAKQDRKNHADAMAAVIQEFINFNIPSHKMLQLSNDIGLWWFSKYQLRIFSVMYQNMKERPAESLSIYALTQLMGTANIFGSIPGITKGAMQAFGNPFTVLKDSVPNIATLDTLGNVL